MRTIPIILLVLLFFCSCEKAMQTSCDDQVLLSEDAFTNGPFDGTSSVFNANWNGECMTIAISYTGGCADHDVKFAFDGSIIKTNPPIVTLAIIHDNTDECDGIVSETLELGIEEFEIFNEYETILVKFKDNDVITLSINL